MTYLQSLRYLNSFYDLEKTMALPSHQRWRLSRMRRLLRLFGHPEKAFLPVLIVGTKGKGSTGFFLQSILNAAGSPAGLYSSPHLETPRERIRIAGKMISKPLWAELLTGIRRRLSENDMSFPQLTESLGGLLDSVTYFEIMTLMAALAFKETGQKVGVFEAGMGGRLDATHALGAKLIVITPIGLDHQEFLGNSVRAIAREKSAVIHRGAEVISLPQSAQAEAVIRTRVRQQRARFWPVPRKASLPVGLAGEYQRWNAAAALKAAENAVARMPGLRRIPAQAVRQGLSAKDWPGRFEIFSGSPPVILDGAHNPLAMKALVKTLRSWIPAYAGMTQAWIPAYAGMTQTWTPADVRMTQSQSSAVLVFSTARDKDAPGMLKILGPYFKAVVVLKIPGPRSQEPAALLRAAGPYFDKAVFAAGVPEALRVARALAGRRGPVLVTGSFYLAGAARHILKKERPHG